MRILHFIQLLHTAAYIYLCTWALYCVHVYTQGGLIRTYIVMCTRCKLMSLALHTSHILACVSVVLKWWVETVKWRTHCTVQCCSLAASGKCSSVSIYYIVNVWTVIIVSILWVGPKLLITMSSWLLRTLHSVSSHQSWCVLDSKKMSLTLVNHACCVCISSIFGIWYLICLVNCIICI